MTLHNGFVSIYINSVYISTNKWRKKILMLVVCLFLNKIPLSRDIFYGTRKINEFTYLHAETSGTFSAAVN